MLHLSGKSKLNEHNLTGKSIFLSANETNIDLQRFRKDISSFYIVPLSSKQWSRLHENLFFLSKFKTKLKKVSKSLHNLDLTLYADLFDILELLAEEHKQAQDLEKKLNSILSTRDQFFTMVYKTKRIRLLPEYEIYDSILGKPYISKGEKYKDEILTLIKSLLERDRITFDQIKDRVLCEFSINCDYS